MSEVMARKINPVSPGVRPYAVNPAHAKPLRIQLPVSSLDATPPRSDGVNAFNGGTKNHTLIGAGDIIWHF